MRFHWGSARWDRWLRCAQTAMIGACLAVSSMKSAAEVPVGVTEVWWAFRPVASPPVPQGATPKNLGPENPIDAFVRRSLSAKSLSLSPQASPRELLRRLHIDLVGLPPTPEETAAFERDVSPEAWARRVDALLASPR